MNPKLRKPKSINRELILQYYNEKWTDAKIAEKLKVTTSAVNKIRRTELKLASNHPRMGRAGAFHLLRVNRAKIYGYYKLGRSYEELAEKYHCTVDQIITAIGFHLMDLCRGDKDCPFKALLPEYEEAK